MWWLVAFLFVSLVLCSFLGGVGTPLSFISCTGIFLLVDWFVSFLQSSAWCCASVTLVMGILYTAYTSAGFTPSLFLHERPLNMTKSVCTYPWCPTPPEILMPVSAQLELFMVCCLVGGWLQLIQFTAFAYLQIRPHIHVYACISVSHRSSLSSSSGEEEVAHGMKVWRKALTEVRSAAQLAMCIQQLQKSIAWERSIMKVVSGR